MANEERELRRWCIQQIVGRGYSSIKELLDSAKEVEDYVKGIPKE